MKQRYDKVRYDDIEVSYLPELDGGGNTFGQQFVNVVREKFGHVGHLFEFCAGPGFIGFSLLARGLCDRLTLADVNPVAVDACRETIRENGLAHRAKVYLSDGLNDVPPTEKWDLVVCNPPHFDGTSQQYETNRRVVDPAWAVHRGFYRDVGKYMKSGGSIVFQENGHASQPDAFFPMIEASGLRVVEVFVLGSKTKRPPRNPSPSAFAKISQKLARKVLLPFERALMTPTVERAIYHALQRMPILMPAPYYFIWSKPRESEPK